MKYLHLLLLVLAVACGGGGGSQSSPPINNPPPPLQAPANLSYSATQAVYVKGVTINPINPTTSGGTPTAYSVSPSLPTGLSLNTTSGDISGTPTVVSNSTSYLVTASNSAGFTQVTLNITVTSPPPTLTAIPDVNFQNALIALNVPISNGHISSTDALTVTEIIISSPPDSGKIQSIAGVEAFLNLTKLQIEHQSLTSVDISKNTKLTWVVFSGNLLIHLDVTKLTKLQLLGTSGNDISTIDLSQNIDLVELDAQHLGELDDPGTLWGKTKGLTSLDITHNTNLQRIYLDANRITTIDLSNNPLLTDFWAMTGSFTSLDFSKNHVISVIAVPGNQLTSLSIKGAGVPRTLLTLQDSGAYPSGLGNPNLTQILVDNVTAINAWAAQYPGWYKKDSATQYAQ